MCTPANRCLYARTNYHYCYTKQTHNTVSSTLGERGPSARAGGILPLPVPLRCSIRAAAHPAPPRLAASSSAAASQPSRWAPRPPQQGGASPAARSGDQRSDKLGRREALIKQIDEAATFRGAAASEWSLIDTSALDMDIDRKTTELEGLVEE